MMNLLGIEINGTKTRFTGAVIRDLRKSKKLSLKKLDAASGVNYRTIFRIENSETKNPKINTVIKLLLALGGDVEIVVNISTGDPEQAPQPVQVEAAEEIEGQGPNA